MGSQTVDQVKYGPDETDLSFLNNLSLGQWLSEVLMDVIQKMMFVSGETADPSVETTSMIEEIVHTQVVEMVSTGFIIGSLMRESDLHVCSSNDLPLLQLDVDPDPSLRMIYSFLFVMIGLSFLVSAPFSPGRMYARLQRIQMTKEVMQQILELVTILLVVGMQRRELQVL